VAGAAGSSGGAAGAAAAAQPPRAAVRPVALLPLQLTDAALQVLSDAAKKHDELKFRTVRTNNAKMAPVLKLRGAKDILLAAGFHEGAMGASSVLTLGTAAISPAASLRLRLTTEALSKGPTVPEHLPVHHGNAASDAAQVHKDVPL